MIRVEDRRARKKRETLRALASAARQLTLERGLDAVTVEEIAAAADVSPRTFFNYYSSKEEAIIGIDPGLVADLGAQLEARPAHERPLNAVAEVLVASVDDLPDVARRFAQRIELVRRYPALLPRYLAGQVQIERALIRSLAIRLGVDADLDPYPTIVVSSAVAVHRSTVNWWHEHDQSVPLPQALRSAFDALAAGMPVPGHLLPSRTPR